jgi:hypothetical protein
LWEEIITTVKNIEYISANRANLLLIIFLKLSTKTKTPTTIPINKLSGILNGKIAK